jgi:adenosylhomocysteine nucleosidase
MLGIRHLAPPLAAWSSAPCRAVFHQLGRGVALVVETGVGQAAADRMLDWLATRPPLEGIRGLPSGVKRAAGFIPAAGIKPAARCTNLQGARGEVGYRPRFVVTAGFCGALHPDLRVGDLVLATEVIDAQGRRWPCSWPGQQPCALAGAIVHRGRLLTVPTPLCEPDQKRRMGHEQTALAVDMETAAIARWCQCHAIPFGSLRAVSDEQRTALSPALAGVVCGGRVAPVRLAAVLLGRPYLAAELYQLARATRRAAARLGAVLATLVFGE